MGSFKKISISLIIIALIFQSNLFDIKNSKHTDKTKSTKKYVDIDKNLTKSDKSEEDSQVISKHQNTAVKKCNDNQHHAGTQHNKTDDTTANKEQVVISEKTKKEDNSSKKDSTEKTKSENKKNENDKAKEIKNQDKAPANNEQEESEFAKSKYISREEFCELAIEMIESYFNKPINVVMTDKNIKISKDDYFQDCQSSAVAKAKALGITNGVSKTQFLPKRAVTNEEAIKFLATTAIACDEEVKLEEKKYNDSNQISDWAKLYTGYIAKLKIMEIKDNKFNPKKPFNDKRSFIKMKNKLKNKSTKE